MATEISENKQALITRFNAETSKIAWKEIQTFFASGNAVFIDATLDLIDIAAEFSLDNHQAFAAWIETGKVGVVTDEQAQQWFDNNATVWAVVVAPWVLVQAIKS